MSYRVGGSSNKIDKIMPVVPLTPLNLKLFLVSLRFISSITSSWREQKWTLAIYQRLVYLKRLYLSSFNFYSLNRNTSQYLSFIYINLEQQAYKAKTNGSFLDPQTGSFANGSKLGWLQVGESECGNTLPETTNIFFNVAWGSQSIT